MSGLLGYCLCMLLCASLASFGAGASEPTAVVPARLVGTWQLMGTAQSLRITFESDGTYRAASPAGVDVGNWRIRPKSLIQLTDAVEGIMETWNDASQPPRVSRFHLSDHIFTVIDRTNRFHRHRRLKP
jgi:hypothetical protein